MCLQWGWRADVIPAVLSCRIKRGLVTNCTSTSTSTSIRINRVLLLDYCTGTTTTLFFYISYFSFISIPTTFTFHASHHLISNFFPTETSGMKMGMLGESADKSGFC